MVYKIMSINELSDDLIAHYFPMLTEAKQKKISMMRTVEERSVALCCEIVARQCLSEVCDAPEFSFELLCNPNSKSVVGNYKAEISIVKNGEFVACAASKKSVGIGLIDVKPFSFREAQNIFSDSEIRAVFSDSVYPFSDIVNMNECKEESVVRKFALLSSLKDAHFYSTGRGIRSEIIKTTFELSGDNLICSDKECNILCSYIDIDKNIAVSIIER